MAVGLAPIATHAQEAWSLRQCIDYAIEHNVSVLQTQNTAEQQKVDVNTKKWARLPNLNGSGGEGFSWGRTSTLVKDETTGNYNSVYVNTSSTNTSFSLNTNVPLFTGFSIPNQYSLAKLNLKAAIADLEKAKEDIAVNIASSFLQVLFKEELSKVAKEQVALSKEQLNRSLRLNEVGKASSAQVAEAKTRVAQDELSAVQADNDYRLALLDLSQLLELPTMEGFKITAPELEPQFTPLTPPDEVFVQAAASRPSILAAQYRLEGSENSIRIAQSNYYPQLSLNGSLGTDYYSTLDRNFKQQMNDNFSKYIGFSLSIPIFNRFETRNKIRTARLQQSYLSMQVENVKKSLYKEIQQAWYSAVAAESKYNSSTVAVDANQESFRLMSQKLENGKATSVEYNESKLNLMKALSDRIQAKYDYIFRTKILDFYKGKPIQ
ncbi:MAG: TolC family protein [Bacteroidetes bacterium]|nr:TolC family protein [Bacteroidota bacterium]